MGIVTRIVRVAARNKQKGMTSLELIRVLERVPQDMVPKVEIGMNGRIKAIKLQVEFNSAD